MPSQRPGAKSACGAPLHAARPSSSRPVDQSSRETLMKLKILAIVALAVVGIGAVVVAAGGLPTQRRGHDPVPDRHGPRPATSRTTSPRPAPSPRAPPTALAFGSPAHLAGATAAAANGSTTWTATEVKAKVGDTVKKGEVLATADTTDLKRQLADANTAIDTAKISLRAAKAEPVRRERRRRHRPDPPGEDRRQQRRDPARRTRARRATTWPTQIKLATLTAPIDGIVTAVNVVTGPRCPVGRRDRHRRHDLRGHRRRRRERPRLDGGRADRRRDDRRGRRRRHRHGHGHRPDGGRRHDAAASSPMRSRSRWPTCPPRSAPG